MLILPTVKQCSTPLGHHLKRSPEVAGVTGGGMQYQYSMLPGLRGGGLGLHMVQIGVTMGVHRPGREIRRDPHTARSTQRNAAGGLSQRSEVAVASPLESSRPRYGRR